MVIIISIKKGKFKKVCLTFMLVQLNYLIGNYFEVFYIYIYLKAVRPKYCLWKLKNITQKKIT